MAISALTNSKRERDFVVGDPPSSQKKADNSLNFAVYI